MLSLIQSFANTVGANTCLLCSMAKVSQYGLCQACETAVPRWYPRCLKHLAIDALTTYHVHYDFCFAPLRWSLVTQQLIHRYKTSGHLQLAQSMGLWMAAHFYHCYRYQQLDWPDRVVAMPTTVERWRKRGFHHTGLLTEQLARHLPLPYVSGALRLLKKVPKQKRLKRSQRWQSAKDSQYCTLDVSGQSIAVVDDLISSSATIAAAAQALKKRGARQVHAWALIYNPGD